MIALRPRAYDVLLLVHAQPRARKNRIDGEHAGRLKVAVTQAPDKGKANVAILRLIAQALSLKKSQLQLVAGTTSHQKMVLIQNANEADIGLRLENVLKQESS